jgi:hypothetical protein
MRSLYFIKPSRPYNPGEVAGFADEVAQRLIDLGAAVPLDQRGAEEAKIAAEEAKKPAKRAAKRPAKKAVKK